MARALTSSSTLRLIVAVFVLFSFCAIGVKGVKSEALRADGPRVKSDAVRYKGRFARAFLRAVLEHSGQIAHSVRWIEAAIAGEWRYTLATARAGLQTVCVSHRHDAARADLFSQAAVTVIHDTRVKSGLRTAR
jgi:hypothetical protein